MKRPTIAICVKGGEYRFHEYEYRVPKSLLNSIIEYPGFKIKEWFSKQYCAPVCAFDATSEEFPAPQDISSLIITGSPHMVDDEFFWISKLEKMISYCIENGIPVLGICFGHQLLCKILGGTIKTIDKFMIGTKIIDVDRTYSGDWLFNHLPKSFPVLYSRKQAVIEVPHNVKILNTNSPFIDIIAYKNHVRGVQFHPELTPELLLYATYVKEHLLHKDSINVKEARNSIMHYQPIYSKMLLKNYFQFQNSTLFDRQKE